MRMERSTNMASKEIWSPIAKSYRKKLRRAGTDDRAGRLLGRLEEG